MRFPFRSARPTGERILSAACVAAIAIGLVLRAADVARPIDHTSYHSWRECDLGMIARNFWRGDMNILYPRIDWGGDGPGLVESEFPLHAWLMALSYRLAGYHEVSGRILSLAIALASLLAFHRLARRLLAPRQALLALAVFSLNPLYIRFATAIQPDPGMMLASILAVLFLLRWRDDGRPRDALAAAALTALAILLKAPALCLGPVLAAVCLERLGPRAACTSPLVWTMAAIALLPPLAWYAHAHTFWLAWGNSLGLTNESHWIGRDMLADPHRLLQLLFYAGRNEAKYVFGGCGLLLAAFALWRPPPRTRVALYWLASAGALLLAALRTTADTWAIYYHAIAVPPACLLIGLGAHATTNPPAPHPRRPHHLLAHLRTALALTTLAALLLLALRTVDPRHPPAGESPSLRPKFDAAAAFRPLIPTNTLVVTLGDNPAIDENGRPIAHDDSALLFWLDRRGFTLPLGQQSVTTLRGLHQRGAQFMIAPDHLDATPALLTEFPVVATCGPYLLCRLSAPSPAPH